MTAQTPPADATTVFHRIASTVAADAASCLGAAGPARVGRIDVAGNPWSRTARIEILTPDGPVAVFAKLPLVDDYNRQFVHERLEREHRMLLRMTEALAEEPQLWVVRPVAYLAEWPALVTAETAGPTLQQDLGAGTRRWAGSGAGELLEDRCELAGSWLKTFQFHTADAPGPFDLTEVLDYCGTRLEQIRRAAGDFFSAGFEQRYADHLRGLAAAIDPSEPRRCARHNDYAPHNIIVAATGVHVLDFTMIDTGDRACDVANFWERLDLLATDPLRSGALVRRLQRRFLAGYGDPAVTDDPGFAIARCRYRLTQVASLVQAEAATPLARWRRHRAARGLRHWLETRVAGEAAAAS